MDRIKRNKWPKNLRRYSYPAIVILIGVLLMLLPGQKKEEDNSEVLIPPNETFEERLEKILSSVHGAGVCALFGAGVAYLPGHGGR